MSEANDADTEDELRSLLHRGVPQLGAPADRMRLVRRRVVRGKRRRVAVAAGTTSAAVLAVLVAVLPPPASGPPADLPPAGSPLSASAATSSVRHLPGLNGLTLTLPAGWHAETGVDGNSEVTGFAANRSLVKVSCPPTATGHFSCSSLTRLAKNGVLISFRQDPDLGGNEQQETFTVKGPTAPTQDCRAIGGDQEMLAWGAAAPGDEEQHIGINAYACLRDASDVTVKEAGQILNSVEFTHTPSAPPTRDG